MTEVPEHLLRRSRERREALGLATSGDGGGAEPPSAPAAAPASPPASASPSTDVAATGPGAGPPAVLEEPEPEVSYVAKPDPGRSKNPLWVMPVLVGLPLWAFFYASAFNPPRQTGPVDPLVLGATVYKSAGCSGCHGAGGEGGVGPPLTGGQAKLTFPNEADHISWVKTGSGPFSGQKYGDPKRPGGQHGPSKGVMPGFASLPPAQIEAVVKYEREKL